MTCWNDEKEKKLACTSIDALSERRKSRGVDSVVTSARPRSKLSAELRLERRSELKEHPGRQLLH